MLKSAMKAVLGISTSKEISWGAPTRFIAVEVMTVWAKRDVTVQAIVMLYTSTFWKEKTYQYFMNQWRLTLWAKR